MYENGSVKMRMCDWFDSRCMLLKLSECGLKNVHFYETTKKTVNNQMSAKREEFSRADLQRCTIAEKLVWKTATFTNTQHYSSTHTFAHHVYVHCATGLYYWILWITSRDKSWTCTLNRQKCSSFFSTSLALLLIQLHIWLYDRDHIDHLNWNE